MQGGGDGVERQAAARQDEVPGPFTAAPVIQFGIFCCAITMVIVLAVAVASS
jgi:hypothetical protein